MLSKTEWKNRVQRMNSGLFDLYWNKGKLSLNELNGFRDVVKDIDSTMEVLFRKERFALPSKALNIRREKAQLSNIFQNLEMNLLAAA